MIGRGDRVMNGAVLLIALVFLSVLYATDAQVTYRRSHARMQRLCSRKLSDALHLACRESGYNGPFSNSNVGQARVDPGPGLVEECCHNRCTYEHLQQYCNPLPQNRVNSRGNVNDLSHTASLPHSTTKDLLEQHPQTEMGYAGDETSRNNVKRLDSKFLTSLTTGEPTSFPSLS